MTSTADWHISPQRRERQRRDRNGIIILAGCGLALAALAGILVYNRPVPREVATACPRGIKLQGQAVVIVDRTDRWNPNHTSLLHTALKSLALATKVDDRLTLIPFDGYAETPPSLHFQRCNPGDASTKSPVIHTGKRVEKEYRASFAAPLFETLDTITKPSQAPQTHLVEFLSNVAAHLQYEARATTTRIILFSDLAENTSEPSFLARNRSPLTPAAFTAYFNGHMRDRLKDIVLEIYVVPAPGSTPDLRRRIKDAWTHALTSNAITYSWKDF